MIENFMMLSTIDYMLLFLIVSIGLLVFLLLTVIYKHFIIPIIYLSAFSFFATYGFFNFIS